MVVFKSRLAELGAARGTAPRPEFDPDCGPLVLQARDIHCDIAF